MIAVTTYDDDGQVLQNMTLLDEAEADLNGHWVPGHWDGDAFYIDGDGVLTERPATGLPATHTLTSNTDWTVPDVPEGTVVTIDGDEAGTVDETGLVLSFAVAGDWRVDLTPPFPWRPATCEVTVT